MTPRRVSRLSGPGRIVGGLMLLPYLILLVAFGIVPVAFSIVTSMRPSVQNPGGGPLNYLIVIEDFRFLPALLNVLIFLAIYVPAMLIIVVLMALLLDLLPSRRTLPLRLAYIVPASISGAVAILVWYFLLEPTLSPYRDALHALGVTEAAQIWNKGNLFWIFALIAFFTGAGNWIVVQYGSLQSIPDEILEAARIDGASAIQTALLIKVPLIRRYITYMGVLAFAAGLQVFVEPQLISSSVYPGIANEWSLNQLSYSFAFTSGNLGGAAALSLMLLVACVIAALLVIFRTDFFEKAGVR